MRVWAPSAGSVSVVARRRPAPDARADDGWWSADAGRPTTAPTTAFLLDGDGTPLPDPRSRWQPHGVHGLSRVYDHGRFAWTDASWRGRQLPGSVIYELHVGTFTAGGTLDAAIERLDHLVALGVDLVELMPVAAFPGAAGWGYDGCTRTRCTSPTAVRTP